LGKFVKNDLKQLWSDFVKVYPTAFAKAVDKWQISIACLFAIISAFYLDSPVREIVVSIKNNYAADAFDFGRWYGNGELTLYLFLALYLGGLFFSKYKIRDAGLLIGEAYIFSGLITLIFKSVSGRWRPYTLHGDFSFSWWDLADNDRFSFFSGHASVAFALSAVLASTTKNIYLKSFYYLLAVLTCFSRIYHEQHWFSDVVTGAINALLITKVLLLLHKQHVASEDIV
jgi:membrane-associated phospholipid phosphatase